MKNLKTKTVVTAFFLGITLFANAQSQSYAWGAVNGHPSRIAIGYGSTLPSASSKDAYVINSSCISLDYSMPLASFRKGWDGWPKTSVGLNIGGQYNFGGSGDPTLPLPSAFAVAGQTSSSVAYKGVDPRNPGFRMGIGPQVNFNFGNKFTISPMVLGEYFSMTQKELSAVQTSTANGKTKQTNLWTMPETKTSGFAVTPKLRLHYILTKSIGLFADASYTFGPTVKTQMSNLVPLGNPVPPENTYDQQQIDMGTYVKGEVKSTAFNAMNFGVGVCISFKSRKLSRKLGLGVKPPYNTTDPIPKDVKDEVYKKDWDEMVKGSVKTITPANGEEIGEKPIAFRWTPCLPKPSYSVTYKLKVWQLMQGQNGTQAIKNNKPLIEKSVKDVTEFNVANLLTGPCKPPYMCDFIWSLQVLDATGNQLTSSEPSQFSYRNGWDGVVKGGNAIRYINSTLAKGSSAGTKQIENTSVTENEIKDGIGFRWTPLVPKPREPFTYKLKIWQLMQGQNTSQAMKSNKTLVDESLTDVTEFTIANLVATGPCKPPYMCAFVWQVEAISKKGTTLGATNPSSFDVEK